MSVHQGQLTAAQIPQHFWRTLHAKLKNEVCFQTLGGKGGGDFYGLLVFLQCPLTFSNVFNISFLVSTILSLVSLQCVFN